MHSDDPDSHWHDPVQSSIRTEPSDPWPYDDEEEIDPDLSRKATGCLGTMIIAGILTLVGGLAWLSLK